MKIHINKKMYLFISILFVFYSHTNAGVRDYNANTGDEEYLIICEKMSSPVGGLEAIIKKIKYPETARRAGVQGKVYVLVYVNQSGDVDDVKIVKGIGAGCDEEAIDAVKRTKFSPGVDKGNPVKTKISLSLNFKLSA
jgi:periplasmic protein TonB